MPSQPERRKAASFRVKPSILAHLRQHVRDYSGKPTYLDLASFLESAIEREIQRTELIASGVLPPDDDKQIVRPRPTVVATEVNNVVVSRTRSPCPSRH